MLATGATEIRRLSESDIPAAMRLKEAAGWNQTEADWRRLLALEPHGCFGAFKEERLVGTTTTTTYGNELAWIGMVLVDPQQRRQGIATQLLDVALGYLKERVATVKLDATPEGQPLYERFGFEFESVLQRWSRPRPSRGNPTDRQKVMDRSEVSKLLQLDQLAFGADRSPLIEDLIAASVVAPGLLKKADGTLSGYALARPGSAADYIGPVVTNDPRQIGKLLDGALAQLQGTQVYVDCNTDCFANAQELSERGFVKERDLIRMTLGAPAQKTSPLIFAIAGPEVG